MPDWVDDTLIVGMKCVLWYYAVHTGIGVAALLAHKKNVSALHLGVPIMLGIALAVLEGWITP